MAGAGVVSRELAHSDMFTEEYRKTWLIPESVEELVDAIKSHNSISVGGGNAYSLIPKGRAHSFWIDENQKSHPVQGPKPLLVQSPRNPLFLDKLDRIKWFSPENQLVCIESGVLLSNLNAMLREHGFEVPVGLQPENEVDCVGDLISLNLPHWNMAAAGSWRDWVVKMEIVLASGEIVKSGADVVKNVTGFDLHKLLIGARHTLGVVAEITLRVRPVGPEREWPPLVLQHGELVLAAPMHYREIKRRLQLEMEKGILECHFDDANSMILTEQTRLFEDIPHFSWRSHVYEYALPEFSEVEHRLMKRTKEIFDPTYKLNPGEFGFI